MKFEGDAAANGRPSAWHPVNSQEIPAVIMVIEPVHSYASLKALPGHPFPVKASPMASHTHTWYPLQFHLRHQLLSLVAALHFYRPRECELLRRRGASPFPMLPVGSSGARAWQLASQWQMWDGAVLTCRCPPLPSQAPLLSFMPHLPVQPPGLHLVAFAALS